MELDILECGGSRISQSGMPIPKGDSPTYYYRPQTKFPKVMFLQVSVCPHWGACMVLFRGACMVLFGGHEWIYLGGVVLFRGACMVLFGGVCVVLFGGHAWFYSGGHAWFYSGGMCGFIRGACMVFSVFSDTMRYGQWAGGVHPTGVRSCFCQFFAENCSEMAHPLGSTTG